MWMSATTNNSAPPTAAEVSPAVPAASEAAAPPAQTASEPQATASDAAANSEAESKPAAQAPAKAKAKPPEAASKAAPAKPGNSSAKSLPEAAQSGGRWLKALPADTFVVEHGSAGSFEQAQKLKAKHKELANARIVATRKSPGADEWQFTVVTGPFRSEDRAKSYVSRLDWKPSTRIRDADKLKGQVG
jgi:hypothetical protein